jgi:SH3-like domain-containing protein
MRHHLSIATSLAVSMIALFAAETAHSESFPYEAHIAVPGAPVRSGPGEEFYITDTLAEGQTVEVYRHRHNGWCAIRPTDGSFSWVFGLHVHMLDESLAEIDKPDVPSRIGSRLSRRRNAVQVRLKKSEVVQVLEEIEEGGHTWYKIAPPAGEFRWIHSSCLSRDDRGSGIATATSSESLDSTPPSAVEHPIVTVAANEEIHTDDWHATPVPPPLSKTSPPSSKTTAASVAPQNTTENSATTKPPAATPSNPHAPTPSAPATTNISVADNLSRQLTDVELRLSRTVSEPPASWQIGPLQHDAERLLSQVQTIAERDAVKATLEKLDRFAAIQRRHQQLAGFQRPRTPPPAAADAPITPIPDATAGRFDAVGVLAHTRSQPAAVCRTSHRHRRQPRLHSRVPPRPRHRRPRNPTRPNAGPLIETRLRDGEGQGREYDEASARLEFACGLALANAAGHRLAARAAVPPIPRSVGRGRESTPAKPFQSAPDRAMSP